jgi:hypothetical protein
LIYFYSLGYVVTVQFLMTFNFVFMLIVLVLLVADYVLSRRAEGNPRGFLIGDYNTSETGLRFGLLLYILYVFSMKKFKFLFDKIDFLSFSYI